MHIMAARLDAWTGWWVSIVVVQHPNPEIGVSSLITGSYMVDCRAQSWVSGLGLREHTPNPVWGSRLFPGEVMAHGVIDRSSGQ